MPRSSRSFVERKLGSAAAFFVWLTVAACALAGCGDELLHHLDERQANDAVTVLAESSIAARKSPDDQAGRYKLVVPSDQAARAVRLLDARGLPREARHGSGETFASPGLLPSPRAERARIQAAREADLERALEAVPGVSAARVLLSLPSADPLAGDPSRPRATASVLLRTRGPVALDDAHLRALVAASTDALDPEDVTLLRAAEPASAASPPLAQLGPLQVTPDDRPAVLVGAALALLAALVVGAVLGAALAARRRR
jgi:type III secretion protein J